MKYYKLNLPIFTTILCFTCFLTSSCSKDDSKSSCSTFLECQGATQWEGFVDDYIYLRINNSQFIPTEIFYPEGDCYDYYQTIDNSGGESFEIIENSKDLFTIKINYDYDNSYDIIYYSISEDNLSVIFETYYNNILGDTLSGTLSPSTINLNNVPICD